MADVVSKIWSGLLLVNGMRHSKPPGGLTGGTDALRWTAPNGLTDLEELILETDGSEGWDFGSVPSYLATLGFGQGALYTSALGSGGASHTDPLSGAQWTFQSSLRVIREVAPGVRAYALEDPTPDVDEKSNFGSWISTSPPEPASANATVIVSRVLRGDVDAYNVGGGIQWKGLRIADVYGGSGGEGYGNYNAYTTNNQWDGAWTDANEPGKFGKWLNWPLTNPGSGAVQTLTGGPSTAVNSGWIRFDTVAMLGDLGVHNGWLLGRAHAPDQAIPFVETYYTSSSGETSETKMLHQEGGIRWGAFSWQDYIQFCDNPRLYTMDHFVQIGSGLTFYLADSADPATTTEAYILPPIRAQWQANRVVLHLWKAFFAEYSGKYVQIYDGRVFRKAVAL